jgi:aminotransferase
MRLFVAQKVVDLPPSGIRAFFDLVAGREDIVSLGVGEPDSVTPWSVREAGIYSLEQGRTAYTSNAGLLELRQAISGYQKGLIGNEYDPKNEILITVGVSQGLDMPCGLYRQRVW